MAGHELNLVLQTPGGEFQTCEVFTKRGMAERELLRPTLDYEARRVRVDVRQFPSAESRQLPRPLGSALRISQETLDDPPGIASIDPGVRAPCLNLESQLGQSFSPNVVGREHAASGFHLGSSRCTPIGVHLQENFDEFLEQLESRVRQDDLARRHREHPV